MEKKDLNDTELGIPSKNTEVVRAQSAVSVMMFSPTEHTKQCTAMAKT
jgi:hypothetical protein